MKQNPGAQVRSDSIPQNYRPLLSSLPLSLILNLLSQPRANYLIPVPVPGYLVPIPGRDCRVTQRQGRD